MELGCQAPVLRPLKKQDFSRPAIQKLRSSLPFPFACPTLSSPLEPSRSTRLRRTPRQLSKAPSITMDRRSLDLRRPATSPSRQRRLSVIDLTDDIEPETRPSLQRPLDPSYLLSPDSTSPHDAEVIDLDSSETSSLGIGEPLDDISEHTQSPDVQFISSRTLPDPALTSTALPSIRDWFPSLRSVVPGNTQPAPQNSTNSRRNTPSEASRRRSHAQPATGGAINFPPMTQAMRNHQFARRFDAPSIRTMNAIGNLIGQWHLDYATPAFPLAAFAPTPRHPPTPPPRYSPPPAAREGFTRTPQETDILICPNCLDELSVGTGTGKSKVYVIKACGHVYCGECAKNRFKSKHKGKQRAETKSQPFSICKVPDCGKRVSNPGSMVELYL